MFVEAPYTQPVDPAFSQSLFLAGMFTTPKVRPVNPAISNINMNEPAYVPNYPSEIFAQNIAPINFEQASSGDLYTINDIIN